MLSYFPLLENADECARLTASFDSARPVICLYAATLPVQSISTALLFRKLLVEQGVQTLLLLSIEAANALDASTLSPPLSQGCAVQCADVNILDQIPCISLLIADEKNMERIHHPHCKTLLLQHNIEHSGLIYNYWAEYVLSQTKDQSESFDYSIYPNLIKYNQGRTVTVIPAGYPKLDVLCSRVKTTPLRKRFSYFPTLETVLTYDGTDILAVEREERVLLDGLLRFYPDHELIIRPYGGNRYSRRMRDLRKRYARERRVSFDDGEDNVRCLVDAELLITDASSVYVNFALATLRPSVRLIAGSSAVPSPYGRNPVGYDAPTGQGALSAVRHALNNLDAWRDELERLRSEKFFNPGTACEYICRHMHNILNDTPCNDWKVIDKGDTPFDRPADFLKAFAKPDFLQKYFTSPLEDAIRLHGTNRKIGLAALRAMLRHWRQDYLVQFDVACTFVPPAHIIGLLRYMVRTGQGGETALARLLWALDRWEPQSAKLPSLTASLQEYHFLNVHNAILVARIVRRYTHCPHKALRIVALALFGRDDCDVPPVPDMRLWGGPWQEDAAFLTALLLEAGYPDAASAALETWEQALPNTDALQPSHPVLRALLSRARRQLGLPFFFRSGARLVICCPGISMQFTADNQMAKTVSKALAYGLPLPEALEYCRKAGLPRSLWPQDVMLLERIANLESATSLLKNRIFSMSAELWRMELDLQGKLTSKAQAVWDRRRQQIDWWPVSFAGAIPQWQGKRLAIWGTGGRYNNVVKPMVNDPEHGAKIVVFIDSSVDRIGMCFEGLPVVAPEDAANYAFDVLIIASYAVYPIMRKILELGIDGTIFTSDNE